MSPDWLEIPTKPGDVPPLMLSEPVVTVTVTRPALAVELPLVSLEIPVKSGDAPPLMLSEPAVRLTSPAFPDVKVSEEMLPPFDRVAAPATVTDTVPAAPPVPLKSPASVKIPTKAVDVPPLMLSEPVVTVTRPALALGLPSVSLEIPVSYIDAPPLMLREPAVRLTPPALAEVKVSDEISPPLEISAAPATVTDTVPADPPVPLASVKIPTKAGDVPPLMLTDPVVTVTRPALPVESLLASLKIPVAFADVPPLMLSEPAVTLTSPAFPKAEVSDWISPPLDNVVAPVVVTDTWPGLPLEPGSA